MLRVAQAYFALLAASDQLAANVAEREAFGALLHQAQVREQTGVGPRSDALQAQAFYDATDEAVIDARNALDDARLVLTEIVGTHAGDVVPLREDIPLASPEPATAEDWVASARQDNLDVRAAATQGRCSRARYCRRARPRVCRLYRSSARARGSTRMNRWAAISRSTASA